MNKTDTDVNRNPERLMLGFLCVRELSSLPDKIAILDRFGISDADMASICNCAVQSVRDARQKAKKKGTKQNE
jgi:hypothetical protein